MFFVVTASVADVLMMLHQRSMIHCLINICRQCKPLSNLGSRWQTTSLFPYQAQDGSDVLTVPLPKEAKVVICGGGLMGAAVAYHLAELGWGPQTVLIDKGR
jgi:NADPH-dependent 2,4-dienoyl-CoA reductase/sulfur reductase-like enzyme